MACRTSYESDRALERMAHEIGFRDQDIDVIRPYERIHTISLGVEAEEEERVIRPRSSNNVAILNTNMSTVVFADRRTRDQLQVMSCGHPMVVLSHCSQFWEGKHKSIWQLTNEDRSFLSNLYNRWSHEGFKCEAFSYRPLLPEDHPLTSSAVQDTGVNGNESLVFNKSAATSVTGSNGSVNGSGRATSIRSNGAMTNAVSGTFSSIPSKVLLMPRTSTHDAFEGQIQQASQTSMENANEGGGGSGGVVGSGSSSGSHIFQMSKDDDRECIYTPPTSRGKTLNTTNIPTSLLKSTISVSPSTSLPAFSLPSSSSSSTSLPSTFSPSTSSSLSLASLDKHSSEIVRDQILLGMTASRMQPKDAMTSVIEDFDAAGVRFVFFSPRKFRRAQILPGQMGLETGWNSSISIQDRPSKEKKKVEQKEEGKKKNKPGEEEISNSNEISIDIQPPTNHSNTINTATPTSETKAVAGDWHHTDAWDEKAHLPHGIQEIRHHLDNVDDVPLLVKLFTNSSPSTVRDMLHVMQDHGEIVCVVGSGMRTENASLFQDADVSIAIDCFPTHVGRVHPDGDKIMLKMKANDFVPRLEMSTSSPAPISASSSASSPAPISPRLRPVTASTMSLSSSVNTGSCSLTFVDGSSSYVLVDIIAEARRLLSNIEGTMLAMRTLQLLLISILILSNAVSLPGSTLSTIQIMWLLWCVAPSLALTTVDAAGEEQMQQMVPKNTNRSEKHRVAEHQVTSSGRNGRDGRDGSDGSDTAHKCSAWPKIDKDVFSEKDIARIAKFAAIRVLPTAVAALFVYCWSFSYTMNQYSDLHLSLKSTNATNLSATATATSPHEFVYLWSNEYLLYSNLNENVTTALHFQGDDLDYVQTRSRTWMMSFIVWCFIFIIDGLEHRNSSRWRCRDLTTKTNPCQLFENITLNGSWLVVSIFFLILQAMACIVVDVTSIHSFQPIPPLGLGLFALFWPFVIIIFDEIIKMNDKKRKSRMRKRLRIKFDTKLGAWSPR